MTVQFNERRGFERWMHANPPAQTRFAEYLLGTIARHTEFGSIDDTSAEKVAAAKLLIKDLAESFPEFLQPHGEHDDIGPHTPADPRLIEAVISIQHET
jgi:hypothetical protein